MSRDAVLDEIRKLDPGKDHERINQMHGRFSISNDDFLYVLSTFVYEPIRWNERLGPPGATE
jgi:hypothetical protein